MRSAGLDWRAPDGAVNGTTPRPVKQEGAQIITAKLTLLVVAAGLFPIVPMLSCLVRTPVTKVLFRTYRDGNQELYLMNLDGSNVENLTQAPVDNPEDGMNKGCLQSGRVDSPE